MPVLRSSSLTRKRKHNLAPYSRKLRSKIPRRKRLPLFPIIADSTESVLFARKEQGFTAFPTVSCSSTCFSGDLSCTSGQLIPGSGNVTKKPRSSRQKKGALKGQGNEGNGGLGIEFPKASCSELVAQAGAGIFSDSVKVFQGKFRRRTRSSLKKETAERTAENEGNGTYGVSLSEISCLESLPEADTQNFCRPDKFSEMNSNTKSRQKILVKEGTIFSVTSCLDSFSPPKVRNFGNSGEFSQKNSKLKTGSSNQKDGDGDDASAIAASESSCFGSVQNLSGSNKLRAENFAVRCSESTTEGKHDQFNTDLTCSEQLSTSELEYCDGLESMLSELEAQSFPTPEEELAWICSDSSTPGLADCSPNPYLNSSGHLSETCGPVSVSSACFSLFLQYAKEFTRSNLELELEKSGIENEYSDDFRLLQFEDEEHEESYRKFRCRERRQAFLRDYVEQYSSTEYGDLVLDQRLLMINWIVEKKIKIDERGWSSYDHFNDDFRRETEKYRYRHVLSDNGNFIPVCPLKCSNIHESDQVNLHSSSNDLQMETVFLGVSLLDRFLCIGFFKNERRLQILGLACVTLATRIEENQPLNCIRQKIFQVGSNVYSRPEVVAMEWFVQEVLSFKCFMLTTFNFLWFYLKAAKADEEMEKCAHYLAVLSLVDHEILCFFPSTVAAGLVVLACLAGNKDAACQWILETHIRTKNDDLAECIERLDWMVKFMC